MGRPPAAAAETARTRHASPVSTTDLTDAATHASTSAMVPNTLVSMAGPAPTVKSRPREVEDLLGADLANDVLDIENAVAV